MQITEIPRPEYPRPQLVRKDWINLNGEWQFEIDSGKSGKDRQLYKNDLSDTITVPFCPESKLSGIGNKDFMNAVWYKRDIDIPESWNGKRILVHFGAVDYQAEIWINGTPAGTHRGGYTSFEFDITGLLRSEKNTITVYAEDDTRSGLQPKGKQCSQYYSAGCDYTRTTGIWQTVWLECVSETYISSFKLFPDPDNACVHISADFKGAINKCRLITTATRDGKAVGKNETYVSGKEVRYAVALSETKLWNPGEPNLYDLSFELEKDNKVIDSVTSYFGLRKISWDDNAILINNIPVFQRLVLDQGFYPDGIYTAPTDEDLKKDIEISMGLGFNGARMHEKVFDPRYIYWADKLGYMVWGEHANWGLDITTPIGLERFLPEWVEAVERDFNHPSIVGWCPFNETWDTNGTRQDNEVLKNIYLVTKSLDNTRPVIDTSGNYHVITDIFDIHDYEQAPEVFKARYEPMKTGGTVYNTFPDRQQYNGQPYFVSEYGGIWWVPKTSVINGWGYGNRPQSEEEFIERYKALTTTLLQNPKICAFCYTQLYDVEQEVNGLYTYTRIPKFNPEIIKTINTQKAAIES
jgi:Beta-galactosidase/beta-glucuronidase